jgi:hypothetical protein
LIDEIETIKNEDEKQQANNHVSISLEKLACPFGIYQLEI